MFRLPSLLLPSVGVEVCGRVDAVDALRCTVYLLTSWQKPFSMLSNSQCTDTQYTFHFMAYSYFWPASEFPVISTTPMKASYLGIELELKANMTWNFTCRLTNNEVCALVHFELAAVFGPVLLTEPLHLFALCAGEARHTNRTAEQHGAQEVLNWQVCVPEKTGGGKKKWDFVKLKGKSWCSNS